MGNRTHLYWTSIRRIHNERQQTRENYFKIVTTNWDFENKKQDFFES